MNSEQIYNVLLAKPRSIEGKTWHGLSYQLNRDEDGKVEVREHGWPTKLTLWETDGPELDTLDEVTVKQMIEAALPVDESYVIPPPPVPLVEKYTAEQWLAKEGYGPTQLVTLLDLYAELTAAAKVSPKLDDVKAWTNAILGEYVQSNQPKEDWGAAPFSFNETVIEAYGLLA